MTMTTMVYSSSSSSSTQEPVAERCLSVRFEDSCVLIPPSCPAKSPLRPRIITKSYSLPLWKPSSSKKNVTFHSLVSELNGDTCPETKRAFSLTVSVPRSVRLFQFTLPHTHSFKIYHQIQTPPIAHHSTIALLPFETQPKRLTKSQLTHFIPSSINVRCLVPVTPPSSFVSSDPARGNFQAG